MRKIDWIGTLRNFVVFGILVYAFASAYLISTNKKLFNEYKEYKMGQALIKDADAIDLLLIYADVNTSDVNRRKENMEIAAVKSYVTFAAEYIIIKYVIGDNKWEKQKRF